MIRKNHRFAPFLIFFALLLLNSPAAALAAGGRGFTLGVMPAAPPVVAHTVWSPFVEHLSRETGVAFRLKVYEKMSEFERDLISPDAPDFIFASPLQTVVGHQKQGFIPLVRSASPVWVELVVKSDSPIRSINDLDQHKIAFVGSKSLWTLYLRHVLSKEYGKFSFENVYTGSVANVLSNVLLGKADAGVMFSSEITKQPKASRDMYRTILRTPEISPHSISANPHVPGPIRDAVTHAVLALASSPDGEVLLESLRLKTPVVADYDRDYKALEEIDILGISDWGN